MRWWWILISGDGGIECEPPELFTCPDSLHHLVIQVVLLGSSALFHSVSMIDLIDIIVLPFKYTL